MRLEEFVIPFVGLKVGTHSYDFSIDSAFFAERPVPDIEDGEAEVHLELEKLSTMLVLNFEMKGLLTALCHRCGSPVKLPVENTYRYIVKFGEESFDETEEIIILPENAYELDVKQPIYELIALSVPPRIVHENIADCDQSVIKKLEQMRVEAENQIDPRWENLRNLDNLS